jgi:hypothetical protein
MCGSTTAAANGCFAVGREPFRMEKGISPLGVLGETAALEFSLNDMQEGANGCGYHCALDAI